MTDTVDAAAVFGDLFRAVGPRHADRVHRALARVLHPDAGGDAELMAALNAAHDRRELVSTRSRRSGGGVFAWPADEIVEEWKAQARGEP